MLPKSTPATPRSGVPHGRSFEDLAAMLSSSSVSSSNFDVRALQRHALVACLSSTTAATTGAAPHALDPSGGSGAPAAWRVLVYDKPARDTVLALASGSKRGLFRDCGVTLKMLLDSPRERVPDVQAVYLIRPTEENVELVARDAAQGLYDSLHVNFSSPVSQVVLERFAKRVGESGGASSVARVFDQFLGFVSLEPSLFTLNLTGSFAAYNASGALDQDVKKSMEAAADGLVDALVTLGRVPIVRAPHDGPAEMVARKVVAKIERLLKDRVFQEAGAVEQRPVLLILDRGLDMITPLRHSEAYQCLVDDLVGPIRLNKVALSSTKQPVNAGTTGGVASSASTTTTTHELDAEVDQFWGEYRDAPFQDAIKAQNEAVKEVDERARRLGPVAASASAGGEDPGGAAARELADAVSALPELTERKRSLAVHGNLMRAAFQEIQRRAVPRLHELETRMTRGSGRSAASGERAKVLEVLTDASKAAEDKTRLLCVYALQARSAPNELDELESALQSSLSSPGEKADASRVVAFVRRVVAVANLALQHKGTGSSSAGGGGLGGGGSAAAAEFLLSTTMNWQAAFSGVQERLQSLANAVTGSGEAWGPAARALEAVCGGGVGVSFTQQETAQIDSQYAYLDPKAKQVEVPPSGPRFRGQVQRAIVFVVGGGSYNEHHNVKQYAAQRKREVIYGCTELVSPADFLKQMRDSAGPM